MTKKDKTAIAKMYADRLQNVGDKVSFGNNTNKANMVTIEKLVGGCMVTSNYLFTEEEESTLGVVDIVLKSINYYKQVEEASKNNKQNA